MATRTAVASTLPLAGICVVPDPGAPVLSADVADVAQTCIDQDATLEAAKANRAGDTFTGDVHIAQTKKLIADGTGIGLSGVFAFSPAVTITRTSRAAAFVLSGTWSRDIVGSTGGLVSGGTGAAVCFDIDPPHGSVLASVTVWLTGSAGHSVLPATVPAIDVRKLHMTGGGHTTLATQSDTTLNVTAYEVGHGIAATGIAATIDRAAYRYMVVVSDEQGAGSQAGLNVYGCSFTYAVGPIALD